MVKLKKIKIPTKMKMTPLRIKEKAFIAWLKGKGYKSVSWSKRYGGRYGNMDQATINKLLTEFERP